MEVKSAPGALQVLDLSENIAGQYCGRLLSDYGADVFLIEPEGGSMIRRMPPLSRDGESWLFFHLNSGKQSYLSTSSAREGDLLRMAKNSDVAIVSNLSDQRLLSAVNPRLVVATVTPFGTDEVSAHRQACELIYQAGSGTMVNNGTSGKPPLYGIGNRASFAAGVAAYIGVSAALYERQQSGLGQVVDIAIAEIAASMSTAAAAWNYSGLLERPRNRHDGQVRCRDGFVMIWVYPYQWRDFCAALDADHLLDDPRFSGTQQRERNWSALVEAVNTIVADWPSETLVSALRARRLITARAATLSHLLRDDRHLRERGFFESVGWMGRDVPHLGPPYRFRGSPRKPACPPPAPGQATKRPQSAGADMAPKNSRDRPLQGLRVLDFTTAWAGPMAGRVLAFLGAEVIHMEHATRVDLWRHHNQAFRPSLYPDGVGGARPYNRNVLFNSQNINKRSLSLNIKTAEGRRITEALAEKSDVVLSSFTPGTLERLGLGYDHLSRLNSRVIMAEMPAYGASGPSAKAPAVGATMEMASGMAGLIGYRDGRPTCTGPNYLDPVGGLNAAAAVLTALRHRQLTGKGQYVEVAQVEAAMHFIGAELLAAAETGQDPVRTGNRVSWSSPHDVFPARGEDQWVALAVFDDGAWNRLCGIIPGLRHLSHLPLEERQREEDAIQAIIASWTGERDKTAAASLLNAAGIAAAAVLDGRDAAADPYLSARGLFVTLEHPEAGTQTYTTVPIRLSRTPGADLRAAPCLGQDTTQILSDILGLPPDAIANLERDGTTTAIPT